MKPSFCISLLSLALFAWASADLPKKAPITKYTNLYKNSPFTSKPPPPEPGPVVDPLEDYALCGISPVPGGYRVTLLNKKDPEERITVDPNHVDPDHDFKILEVIRVSGNPLGTTVRLSSGSITGTVGFEESLLALVPPPAAAKPVAQNPGVTPTPGTNLKPGQLPARQPRPRVVPPNPTTKTPTQGGRPQFQPGGQQRGTSSSQRTDRRGRGR